MKFDSMMTMMMSQQTDINLIKNALNIGGGNNKDMRMSISPAGFRMTNIIEEENEN